MDGMVGGGSSSSSTWPSSRSTAPRPAALTTAAAEAAAEASASTSRPRQGRGFLDMTERYRVLLPKQKAGGGGSAKVHGRGGVTGVASAMLTSLSPPFVGRKEAETLSEKLPSDERSFATWTPASGCNTLRWWLFVFTVFADIAPYNLLVLTRPPGGPLMTAMLLLAFAGASLYTGRLVAVTLAVTGRLTLSQAWRDTVGSTTMWMPTTSVVLVCFACCVGLMTFSSGLLATAIPLHGGGRTLIATAPQPAGPTVAAAATELSASESVNLWTFLLTFFPVSFFVLFKDVASMYLPTIVAGMSSLFTAAVVVKRAFDGSYAPGGRFAASVAERLAVAAAGRDEAKSRWTKNSPRVLSIMSVVFLVHFNAPKYYRELEHCSKESYTQGMALAMGLSAVLVLLSVLAEQATFHDTSADILLERYSDIDQLANAARISLAVGFTGSFALAFAGLREALLELLSDQLPAWVNLFDVLVFQHVFSFVLLAIVVGVACVEGGDFTAVNVVRSTFGSLLIYVIPSVLFLRLSRKYVALRLHCGTRFVITSIGILGLVLAVFSFIVHTDPILKSEYVLASSRFPDEQ